jgi:hypothetical protein
MNKFDASFNNGIQFSHRHYSSFKPSKDYLLRRLHFIAELDKLSLPAKNMNYHG